MISICRHRPQVKSRFETLKRNRFIFLQVVGVAWQWLTHGLTLSLFFVRYENSQEYWRKKSVVSCPCFSSSLMETKLERERLPFKVTLGLIGILRYHWIRCPFLLFLLMQGEQLVDKGSICQGKHWQTVTHFGNLTGFMFKSDRMKQRCFGDGLNNFSLVTSLSLFQLSLFKRLWLQSWLLKRRYTALETVFGLAMIWIAFKLGDREWYFNSALPLAGEADWLCAGKCYNLSAGKSPRAIIQKRGSKTV